MSHQATKLGSDEGSGSARLAQPSRDEPHEPFCPLVVWVIPRMPKYLGKFHLYHKLLSGTKKILPTFPTIPQNATEVEQEVAFTFCRTKIPLCTVEKIGRPCDGEIACERLDRSFPFLWKKRATFSVEKKKLATGTGEIACDRLDRSFPFVWKKTVRQDLIYRFLYFLNLLFFRGKKSNFLFACDRIGLIVSSFIFKSLIFFEKNVILFF
jgi:hypothetical protein